MNLLVDLPEGSYLYQLKDTSYSCSRSRSSLSLTALLSRIKMVGPMDSCAVTAKISKLRERMEQLQSERQTALDRQSEIQCVRGVLAQQQAARAHDGVSTRSRRDSIGSIESIGSVHSTRTEITPQLTANNRRHHSRCSNTFGSSQETEANRSMARRCAHDCHHC
eukprot:SAG31_NODE_1070_length_10071_cov_6.989771_8_plen_165_part_00